MQGSKLYVGNFKYSITREQLEELFSNYGEVREVKIIEGKGFGFIEMSNQAEAGGRIWGHTEGFKFSSTFTRNSLNLLSFRIFSSTF